MKPLSKAIDVESSIVNMRKILESLQLQVSFGVSKHPLNHCYSINMASVIAPQYICSNGKGNDEDSCMASAMGEFIERLQSNNFFNDFYLPQRKYYPDQISFQFGNGYLNDELLEFYSGDDELQIEDLIDFNSDDMDTIVSLPFVDEVNKNTVFFPINILNNLYLSNGLATGNTLNEAKVQAMSEIFGRFAKIQIIKNGYALPLYPQHIISQFYGLNDDINQLRESGYIIDVLDASLGGIYPVVAISLINPKTHTLFVSFGSHPILQVALERTLSELMQGRDLSDLDTFERPTLDMSIISDDSNIESHYIDSNGKIGLSFVAKNKTFEFTGWKYQGATIDDECKYLIAIASLMDKKIYTREFDYLGIYTVQMIVPSLSEVYPVSDLVTNNKNSAKFIREMLLDIHSHDYEEVLDNINDLEDTLDVGRYIGVIFESPLTIRDIKIQLYLWLQSYDEVLELLEHKDDDISYVLSQLILIRKNSLSWDDYKDGFESIFGKEQTIKAYAILENKVQFIDSSLAQEYLNILNMYDRLSAHKIRLEER